jgi:hypothetical protein
VQRGNDPPRVPLQCTDACGKLYRRKCFEEIRYPLGKLHEDEFTTYKILFEEKHVSFVDSPLYFYYHNPKSITNQWNPKRLDVLDALEDQILFFKEKSLEKAYKWSCYHLLENIAGKLQNIGANLGENEEKLRIALRSAIKRYKKDSGVSYKTHQWIYWHAYSELRLYFRIKNKIRKLFCNYKG